MTNYMYGSTYFQKNNQIEFYHMTASKNLKWWTRGQKCQFSASPLKIPKVLYNWFFRLLLSSFNCYFDMTPG